MWCDPIEHVEYEIEFHFHETLRLNLVFIHIDYGFYFKTENAISIGVALRQFDFKQRLI